LIQSYTKNGTQNKYQAGYEKAKRRQSATKVFISTFGKRRNQVVSYTIYLRRQGKCYQSRSKSEAGRGHIRNRVSINERPAIVDEKTWVGDWEIDLVIGEGYRGTLVTIVACATSFTVSKRVNGKSADTGTAATISLLEPYKVAVLTITADNRKEVCLP
jgi:IS30 family transposase